jgi:esterase/lipase superfamily enzyme
MWGNNSVFHRLTLGYISEMIDNGQDNILLSVILPANQVGYKQNWKKVTTKGNRLGGFFTCIAREQKAPVNILSHSMGNRVFQGMWQQAGNILQLENVVLASPDLDTDIFENDFKNLAQHSQRIIVVQHHHDRLLLVSSLVLGKERLGRTRHISPVPANMTILDATTWPSSRRVDMSNHLHFIFADSVRYQLKKLVH